MACAQRLPLSVQITAFCGSVNNNVLSYTLCKFNIKPILWLTLAVKLFLVMLRSTNISFLLDSLQLKKICSLQYSIYYNKEQSNNNMFKIKTL